MTRPVIDAEALKNLLDKMKLEYRLYDAKGRMIFTSGSYAAEEKKNGHSVTEMDAGTGRIFVHVARNDEAVREVALLNELLSFNAAGVHKKKVTFDSLFSDLIEKGMPIGEDSLKELRIKPESKWTIITVLYRKEPEESIKGIFRDSLPKGAAVAVHRETEGSTVLLTEVPSGITGREMLQYAEGLYNMLETEFGEKVNIGVSAPITGLGDVRKAIGDSRKAAYYGKLLSGKDGVHAYEKLGLAKAVANLSPETEKRLSEELIRDSGIDLLDGELIRTIRVYFQNNMNVSETARDLYIHRNTLNYRLEKVLKLTGLDLARFDDAAYLRMVLILKSSIEGDKA